MSRDEGWLVANQRVLMAELTLLRERLERADAGQPEAPASPEAARALAEARAALPGPSALDGLCRALSLSAFERTLLLLCVGVELDGSLGAWCAQANGDARQPWPTLGLALAALPGAHWSALVPEAPLRRLMLVEVKPGELLTASPLRVAERVLHHLLGLESLEERLLGLAEPLEPPERLPHSQHEPAQRAARAWALPEAPLVQLLGAELSSLREVGSAACALRGSQPLALRATALPATPSEQEQLCRLLERESLLGGRAWLLECEEPQGPATARALALAERLRAPALLLAREPLAPLRRPLLPVHVPPLAAEERHALWLQWLGPLAAPLERSLSQAVRQFPLGPASLRAAAAEVVARAAEAPGQPLEQVLWEACRTQAALLSAPALLRPGPTAPPAAATPLDTLPVLSHT